MRAFLAISLPEGTRTAVSRLQSTLPVGRAVPTENLHLTLAFLEDRNTEELSQLHYELETVQTIPFEVTFCGLGSLGSASPKVLCADVAKSEPLKALHGQVVRAARRAGMTLTSSRFRPHVTVARIGRGLDRQQNHRLGAFVAENATMSLPGFTVNGFSLFQSTLHRGGAIHDELAHYPFG